MVAACKGAVKSGDVYRWKGSAVPATTTRPSILLAPVNELPVLSSPSDERADRTYRWQVVDGNNGSRAVAMWRRPDGGWSLVRRIETCARLLAITPNLATT